MISETMPLNEWPSEKLQALEYMLKYAKAPFNYEFSKIEQFHQNRRLLLEITEMAIKAAEEREAKLPY
jgi:hypothetical protein